MLILLLLYLNQASADGHGSHVEGSNLLNLAFRKVFILSGIPENDVKMDHPEHEGTKDPKPGSPEFMAFLLGNITMETFKS